MSNVYKFEVMFRGQQVIVEYELDILGELVYAIISCDTPYFIHPDYYNGEDNLDEFHWEVYQLTKDHILKVEGAKNNSSDYSLNLK